MSEVTQEGRGVTIMRLSTALRSTYYVPGTALEIRIWQGTKDKTPHPPMPDGETDVGQ